MGEWLNFLTWYSSDVYKEAYSRANQKLWSKEVPTFWGGASDHTSCSSLRMTSPLGAKSDILVGGQLHHALKHRTPEQEPMIKMFKELSPLHLQGLRPICGTDWKSWSAEIGENVETEEEKEKIGSP